MSQTALVNKYELTVILDGEATAAKKKAVRASVEKIIKIFKGKVLKFDDWGVKKLSYRIQKSEKGAFQLYELALGTDVARELGLKLRLNDDIIRYLLIRQDTKKVKE